MKKYQVYYFILLLLTGASASAQSSIVPIESGSALRFSSLWNFNLNITDATYSEYHVAIELSEQGKRLFTVESERLQLSVGTYFYTSANIENLKPFRFSYLDRSFSRYVNQSNPEFPDGNYSIQYTLKGKKQNSDQWEEVFSIANQKSVFNYVNVLLISVQDGDTIKEKQPFFIWTPIDANLYNSGDGNGAARYLYAIRICKILEGQTREMALLNNQPVFERNDIAISNQLYPSEAILLENNSSYVWQVSAFRNGTLAAKSELWVFHYSDEIRQKKGQYVWMKTSIDHSFSIVNDGILSISYTEQNKMEEDAVLAGKIYTEWGQMLIDLKDLKIPIHSGTNQIKIDLCGADVLLAKGNYTLILFNGKGEKYFLNFSNETNDCTR